MKKLVAYITTGYPSLDFTEELLDRLQGIVDIVELGMPFSDPVADGEVIAKANMLALERGIKFPDLLEISKRAKIPHYIMSYANIFLNYGIEKIEKTGELRGLIIPDMPYEESVLYMKNTQLENIPFVAPTDSKERIQEILKDVNGGFVYLVAYAGITGANRSEKLDEVIKNIRDTTDRDVYIGFGVNEENAGEKVKGVDGVIVGTHFIKILLDDTLSYSEKIQKIVKSASNIRRKIDV